MALNLAQVASTFSNTNNVDWGKLERLERISDIKKLEAYDEKSTSLELGKTEWGKNHIDDYDFYMITERYSNLRAINLHNLQNIDVISLHSSFMHFPRLESFHVSKCRNLHIFKIVAPLLHTLEVLDNEALQKIQVRIQFSAKIVVKTPFPKLEISRFSLKNSDFEKLKDIQVDSFDLSYCDTISDTGLKHLSGSIVKKLTLRNCPKITLKGLIDFLDRSHHLEDLTLSACSEKIPLSLIFSEKFGKLKRIDLSEHKGIFDTSILEPSFIPRCTALSLSNCSELDALALTFLKNWHYLKELRIANCQGLTDADLDYLSPLQLEKLTIAKCKWLTNAGLKVLEQIKTLQIVNIKGCPQ